MRNFKLLLEYEGTRYQGWQKQENTENTIQGKLETLLCKMCGSKVEVQGSGRTDAGVHARGQVANAHMDTDMTAEEILAYMNRYLPKDIGVVSVEEVPERFHSRLLVKEKTYCYQVINSSMPHIFDRRYSYAHPAPLNVEAMRAAAGRLVGTHDFAAFTSAKKEKIYREKHYRDKDRKRAGYAAVLFSGNGFLFHMVRILTGTLLEVGEGRRAPEDMEVLLTCGNREQAGTLVPALGLTLLEVRY